MSEEVRFLSVPIGMPHAAWKQLFSRIGIRLATAGIIAVIILLFWKTFLPFAAALGLAALLQKPYRALSVFLRRIFAAKTTRGQKPQPTNSSGNSFFAALIVVLGCVFGGGAVLLSVLYLLFAEIGRLFTWIGANTAVISTWIGTLIDRLTRVLDNLPIPESVWNHDWRASVTESVFRALPSMIGGLAASVSSTLSAWVSAVITALPSILLFFAVFLIASVYMTLSFDTIRVYLYKHLPRRIVGRMGRAANLIGGTVRLMLRAYCLLALLSFVLLFIGLLLLGVKRALGLALIGMLFDFLPIFGVGGLLIPYAIASFFGGYAGRGVGLVLLYLVISFSRQALEPRLIGKTAGVHPLAVLFALYAGGTIFGFWGMIVTPFLLTVVWRGYRMIGDGYDA